MDTLIVTISKDSIVSIKPLSQTSSVLVNNLLKKCSFLGKYISSQYTSKPLRHLQKSLYHSRLFFSLNSFYPPPPFLPNNLTYLLSGIGQLSQISTAVTFKNFSSPKLVFSPFFFFDKETLVLIQELPTNESTLPGTRISGFLGPVELIRCSLHATSN